MISMNAKDWQANIEVRIFIIYMTKSVKSIALLLTVRYISRAASRIRK
jgi:hypothetical protein